MRRERLGEPRSMKNDSVSQLGFDGWRRQSSACLASASLGQRGRRSRRISHRRPVCDGERQQWCEGVRLISAPNSETNANDGSVVQSESREGLLPGKRRQPVDARSAEGRARWFLRDSRITQGFGSVWLRERRRRRHSVIETRKPSR